MIEDITGTNADGQEIPLGTPEGNEILRTNIEKGLATVEDESVRAYHARDWSRAWALRRDEIGILENPGGFDFGNRMKDVGLPFRTPHLFLEPMWTSPYGFADDLDNMKVYLQPYITHPTRSFFVTYTIHHPHVRTGSGPGMVISAVNGTPISCAIRWSKNGPYVGTAIPNPEKHGPEYVCDVPDRSFLRFHVYEYAEKNSALRIDMELGEVATPKMGQITDVVVHLCQDEDPEAVSWTDAAGRHEQAKLIDFVMATGIVRPDLAALAYAAQRGLVA